MMNVQLQSRIIHFDLRELVSPLRPREDSLAPGRGFASKLKEQPHAKQIAHAPQPQCRARTRRGSLCKSPAMPNGRCRMHGGTSPGAPKGNKNAFKHGRYTAEAIARRKEVAELIRTARELMELEPWPVFMTLGRVAYERADRMSAFREPAQPVDAQDRAQARWRSRSLRGGVSTMSYLIDGPALPSACRRRNQSILMQIGQHAGITEHV